MPCRRWPASNPAAERSIGRFCRQMQELDDWLSGEGGPRFCRPRTWATATTIERLRAADGPHPESRAAQPDRPVRDAEEKYVSLLRFLVLRGEGALQLTPQVTYKVKNGALVRVAPPGTLPPPAPPQPALPGLYRLPGGYCLQIREAKI